MKAVILAGGMGTRISEETHLKPKPMIEIGGKPILWHIMKLYSAYNIHEFVICCGYKGYLIKEYFANYFLHMSDVTIDMVNNSMEVHQRHADPWKVTLVDTGESTMTGGRLRRVRDFVGNETFCFTYGDGVSNVNIGELVNFHYKQGRMATLTSVQPPARFGVLELDENRVTNFYEKPQGESGWINGGFFVLEPDVFALIDGDSTIWECEPLERLTKSNQLSAFQHNDFWQPMDTLRDKVRLEQLWETGMAPWKVW
ncbi:glucose-1-phosphate cytidylyltransferase [Pelosinus sp. sgz500959]|uniref:glucose-1-phosphate cytidylyltransferase n=1 Tax=Pelosinus sp. sgz500959 TaxID=3242472 RepID=UPI0036734C47